MSRRDPHLSALLETLAGLIALLSLSLVAGVMDERWQPLPTSVTGVLILLLSLGLLLALVMQQGSLQQRAAAHRYREVSALADISSALLSSLNLEDVLQSTVLKVRETLRADGCSIALLDQERQEIVFPFVTSQAEPTESRLKEVRLPVGHGVVGWSIAHARTALVPDTATDPRFAQQVATQAGWQPRSLLASPLKVDGKILGALEVLSAHPHFFTEGDAALLDSVGGAVALALQRTQLQDRIRQQERLEGELEIASQMQRCLLPDASPVLPGYEIAGWTVTAREMGGDFYDFIPLGDERWGLAVGDVVDKGLPAALYMVIAKSLLWPLARDHPSPGRVLQQANDLLCEIAQVEMFVTLLYGVLDLRRHTFRYANGGHWPPLWARGRAGPAAFLRTQGHILGFRPQLELQEDEIGLEPGASLVIYSDGLTEAERDGTQWGKDRLQQAVEAGAAQGLTGGALLEWVRRQWQEWLPQPPEDDSTLLVVSRKA